MTSLMKNEGNCPLLSASQDYAEETQMHSQPDDYRRRSRHGSSTWYGAIVSIVTVVNVLMLIASWATWHMAHVTTSIALETASNIHSPVDDFIEYETVSMNYTHESVFAGKPRPEFEEAWYNLLYFTKVAVTAEELRAANITSVKLRGGDDRYLAYLEVHHQLHCLKRIVQMRYADHYKDYVQKGMLTEEHFNHCIEVIRKALMCTADTHLRAYAYDKTRPGDLASKSSGQRTCVKWDSIVTWTEGRFAGEHYELDVAQ